MESAPPVSFALVAYNQAQYVREAVAGVLSQTYPRLEVILSDDCSTDDTFNLMREIARNYRGPHKIVLNRNSKNSGLGEHMNTVARLATGEWLVVGAGDDVSLPSRVSEQVNFAKSKPATVAGCCFWQRIDEESNAASGEDSFFPARSSPLIAKGSEHLLRFIRVGYPGVSGCSAIWRRDLFSRFPQFPASLMIEDLPLTIRALLSGEIFFLPGKLVRYRIHADNISQARQSPSVRDAEQKTSRFYARLRQAYEVGAADFMFHQQNFSPVAPEVAREIENALAARMRAADLLSRWWQLSLLEKVRTYLRARSRQEIGFSLPWMRNRLLPMPVFGYLKRSKEQLSAPK